MLAQCGAELLGLLSLTPLTLFLLFGRALCLLLASVLRHRIVVVVPKNIVPALCVGLVSVCHLLQREVKARRNKMPARRGGGTAAAA